MTDFQGCFYLKHSFPYVFDHLDVPVLVEVEVPFSCLFPYFHQMRWGKNKDLSLCHDTSVKRKRNHSFATTDEGFLRAEGSPRSSNLMTSCSCILYAIIDWISWKFAKANSMIWLASRREESFTEIFTEPIRITSRTSTKSISISDFLPWLSLISDCWNKRWIPYDRQSCFSTPISLPIFCMISAPSVVFQLCVTFEWGQTWQAFHQKVQQFLITQVAVMMIVNLQKCRQNFPHHHLF